ncbi:MAG: tetratricopeptide repeat protein [Elusimicrobia bacterium]|nr:tetratricopeptide repeat protein [Elusimicrobiota bacterium]
MTANSSLLKLAARAGAAAALCALCACSASRPRPTIKADSPEDTSLRAYSLGNAALEKGDTAEALRDFHRSIGLDPEYQFGYIGLALAHSAQGDYQAAETYINKAIQLNESNPECYVAHGRVYLAQGEYDKALYKFNLALANDGTYAPAYYWKGRAFELGKNERSAAEMYRKALEADREFLMAGEALKRLQDAEKTK